MRLDRGDRPEHEKRAMVVSAAVLFGGATLIQVIESLVPGGQTFSLVPGASALAFVALLVLVGSRLPVRALAALGPIGVAMVAYSLVTTTGANDGTVFFMWPVLWQSYFFGRRGTIGIVACVAVADGLALLAMPPGHANLDRWIDVISSVAVVGTVVELLAARNLTLLRRVFDEARVDQLTGLLNRRGFEERATVELSQSRRESTYIGVAAFDLDHFKEVNDEFGHEAGDRVLKRLADCLRSELRATDLAARMGGEEFIALLPGASAEGVRAFTERVRDALHLQTDARTPAVTVSAGVSAALAPERIDQLLKRADAALYAAKSRGRDCTVVFDGGPCPAPVGSER
ncbi:MAG: GGDEF domain-containing protein [Solirubrobacteraceae bacterium]